MVTCAADHQEHTLKANQKLLSSDTDALRSYLSKTLMGESSGVQDLGLLQIQRKNCSTRMEKC